MKQAQKLLRGEIATYSIEKRYLRRDGSIVWVNLTGSVVRTENGSPEYFIAVAEEISEKKIAEQRVLRQNAALAGIATIFRESVICDSEEELGRVCVRVCKEVTGSKIGFIGEIDPATGKLNLLAMSDTGGNACGTRDRSADAERVRASFPLRQMHERLAAGGTAFLSNTPETDFDWAGTQEESPTLTSTLCVPLIHLGNTIGIFAVANREGGYTQEELDLAESLASPILQALISKSAERQRRDSARKLQATLDSIADGLLVLDREWRYTYFSETAAKIVHVDRESMLGKVVWDIFPKAKGTKFYEFYHRAVETGEPQHFDEYYPEPLNQWLECHCYPSDEGLTVYFRDITSRMHAEEALRTTTTLLRAISGHTGDVIFAKDREGRLTYANPATLATRG